MSSYDTCITDNDNAPGDNPVPQRIGVLGGINIMQIDNQAVYDAYYADADFFSSWGVEAAPPVDPDDPQIALAPPPDR